MRGPSSDEGTFGSIFIDGKFICCSLELADKDNQPNISRIPEGSYVCTWRLSPKHGMCYHLENVKGRSDILIHSANLASELLGCIALGNSIGKLNGVRAVLDSKNAVHSFEELMKRETFTLTIC